MVKQMGKKLCKVFLDDIEDTLESDLELLEAEVLELEEIAEDDAAIVANLDSTDEKVEVKVELSVAEQVYNACKGTSYDHKDPNIFNYFKNKLGI